jgi:acyl carrier protein
MSNAVQPRVQRTLASVLDLPPEQIRPDTDQKSLPTWDSLRHVHLIAALEAEFAVSIDPEDWLELTSVPAIVACLGKLGAA